MNHVLTDADIEAERLVFERFNALKRSNSPRRVRQEAWREVEAILHRRRVQSMRTHPIAPWLRWWDFNDTAPPGWTYPACRTLELDEVEADFPGARAAFAIQCNDIVRRTSVRYVRCDDRLRVSVPMAGHGLVTRNINLTWLPDVGIWRRYCTHVRSKPHRVLEPEQPSSGDATDSQVWR